jgi:hypothetical protein
MKESRYSEVQVIGALKQWESGRNARELARELGASSRGFAAQPGVLLAIVAE